MKTRSLIVMMLIGLLGFGMIFGGCENGTTPSVPNTEDTATPPKVVAEKYRGTWKNTYDEEDIIIITETTYTHGEEVRTVYSDENRLRYEHPQGYVLFGWFNEDSTVFILDDDNWYSKQ
jgi:hypothetical protein